MWFEKLFLCYWIDKTIVPALCAWILIRRWKTIPATPPIFIKVRRYLLQRRLKSRAFCYRRYLLHLDDVIKISPSTPQLKLVWFFVGLLVVAATTIDVSRWQKLCFFQQIRVSHKLRNKWVGFTFSIGLSITLWILIF